MSAPHFFAPAVSTGAFTLRGDDGRHAARVLRIREGETITVSDGRGHVVAVTVSAVDGDEVRGDARDERFVPEPAPKVVVWPAIAKNDKLDMVVQKLTELGVAEIRPWFSERSIVRWDGAKRRTHAGRWRAIAYEAAKQSRRAWLPAVQDPADRVEVGEATIVLHEEEQTRLRTLLRPGAEVVSLVVGPEGGLSEAEVAAFLAAGAAVAGLGEQVLRAETASIAGVAALMALLGRLA